MDNLEYQSIIDMLKDEALDKRVVKRCRTIQLLGYQTHNDISTHQVIEKVVEFTDGSIGTRYECVQMPKPNEMTMYMDTGMYKSCPRIDIHKLGPVTNCHPRE